MTRLNPLLGALLLAAAAAQPGIDWSQAKPVTVLMVDDSFEPDRLNLLHGLPYRLHMENHGRDLHEFTAPEFLANATVRNPDVLANEGTEVVVHPGQMVDVFLVPTKAGRYRLTCADHDWDGMVGEIVVD
jgi:uncharacterized cupredoxin-like copper-binding protein